jgi:hypothetical protein
MSNTWNSNVQYRRIFGWTEILKNFQNSPTYKAYVDTVTNNLDFAVERNIPLASFTTFVNDEQDGLKWLVYEIVCRFAVNSTKRLEYLRDLVELIENLDSKFPDFVAAPKKTVRKFLEFVLRDDELEYLDLLPPLVDDVAPAAPAPAAPPALPAYQRASANSAYERATANAVPFVEPVSFVPAPSGAPKRLTPSALRPEPVVLPKKCEPISLRFVRKNYNEEKDDIVKICKSGSKYSYSYKDGDSIPYSKVRVCHLTRDELMKMLSNTLRLLSIDEEPFNSVQLFVPNMPVTLITPKNLTAQTRELIYDTVEMTLDNWPSA